LAFHDQLTGLPNRAAFNEHIANTFRSALAGHEEFAVLCVDLDPFKDINDIYGPSDHPRYSGARPRPRIARHCRGRRDRGLAKEGSETQGYLIGRP
jgi:predicted signal transduction protein with EAL and GGDEF domain